MDNTLMGSLEKFDAEIYGLLQKEIRRQRYLLSLLPTSNTISPLSAYLKGSIFGNTYLDHHAAATQVKLEQIATRRACQLFKSEHAIVRLPDISSASRVVFHALAEPHDTILSFNLRKQEHCSGEKLAFDFVKFSVSPEIQSIDLDLVQRIAEARKPRLIIYSPVNYPRQMDYKRLKEIAGSVGAYLWVDIGQNAGAVAAGVSPSPVPYADVVTLPTSDSLHGPQGAMILSSRELAGKLDQAVIDTGHTLVKQNMLAALATSLREAGTPIFRSYCEQVRKNANALEHGLQKAGITTLCSPTETHLVIVKLPETADISRIGAQLQTAGFLVKTDKVPTADESISCPALRLSSLDPTTRGLREAQMEKIGALLAGFLLSSQSEEDAKTTRQHIYAMLSELPLFADDWLPPKAAPVSASSQFKPETGAHEKESIAQRITSFWDN